MEDLIITYMIQYVTLTVGVLALTELAPLRIGIQGPARKRYTAAIYALVGGTLAWWSGLVTMPGNHWTKQLAGVLLLSAMSVATAYGAVSLKKIVKK